jgi:hypothetical protein
MECEMGRKREGKCGDERMDGEMWMDDPGVRRSDGEVERGD